MKTVDRERGDEGFTLIELLVVLVIMPIVIGGLVMMLFAVFQTQTGVSNKLTGAGDTTVANADVTQDVESATSITTQSTPACGSSGTQILGLKASASSNVTSYDLVQSGTKYELVRFQCTSSNTTLPFGETVLSTNVPSTLTATVSCATTCSTSTSWVYGAVVSQVAMSVAETSTGVSYAITAVPGLWNAASEGISGQQDPFPIPPLDVLGTTTCGSPTLVMSGSASLTIANGSGSADDNSTCAGSIAITNNPTITATNIETGASPASSALTSGSATTQSVVYNAPTGDPFTGLSAPTNPTASGSGACTLNGSSGSCTPGNYAGTVNFGSGSTWTVQSGTYVFTQTVTINSATVVFGSGTYLFEGGLSINSGANVTFDNGTYLFQGGGNKNVAISTGGSSSIASGPGGTLFYVESGNVQFGGSGTVSLSGESAYDGIAIWQAVGDTNPVYLSGGSATNAAYGGVYVPGAFVEPAGNSIVSAAFVVSYGFNFGGTSGISIG